MHRSLKFKIGLTFDWCNLKRPIVRFRVLNKKHNCSVMYPEYIEPRVGGGKESTRHVTSVIRDPTTQYNTLLIPTVSSYLNTEYFEFDLKVDESIANEYIFVIEHVGAKYPVDYWDSKRNKTANHGIHINYLEIADIDLCDLIYRRGHIYHDCTDNLYYVANNINNENLLMYDYKFYDEKTIMKFNNSIKEAASSDSLEKTIEHLQNIRRITEELLYYSEKLTNSIHDLYEYLNNDNFYIEKDRLYHHIPNQNNVTLNGWWQLEFKTPFYAWVTDNIFGNDLK